MKRKAPAVRKPKARKDARPLPRTKLPPMSAEAREFLRQCAWAVSRGKPVPQAERLAELLGNLAGSLPPYECIAADAPSPFGRPLMTRKRGEKGGDSYFERQAIALRIWQMQRKYGSLHAARREVMRTTHKEDSTLRKIWAEFRGHMPKAQKIAD